jgi:beta-phosphoglucomutase-like phosphatase (HAD superfamily)/imidazoleglycerol phosphate dehydratase HisB
VILASRLHLPDGTAGLLVDLDGVVLDTLTLEYDVVNELLDVDVPRDVIRRAFPHPIPESWRMILEAIGQPAGDDRIAELTEVLERERASRPIGVHAGIPELFEAAARELPVAVVSNNPLVHIEEMLAHAGVRQYVNAVIGNDGEGVRSKPAPDPYLKGAEALGVDPARCAAIEDSLLGARSARTAGCQAIGVATGSATIAELIASDDVDAAYARFEPPAVALRPGDVRRKTLDTPNEFVSHMLEHVAWRLGCEIELRWPSDDWRWLGEEVGRAIRPLLDGPDSAEALGMIDDGSAEVRVERSDTPSVELTGAGVDVDWFTSLRCEQLTDGRPLIALLDGLAEGAGASARIVVTSLEDPHHTWEAVWRGLGVALRGLSRTLNGAGASPTEDGQPAAASFTRTTAETTCGVTLTLDDESFSCRIETSPSVHSAGLADLVERFATKAGLGMTVDFRALALSSSHVVAEDVGMTIGAALRQLATERMGGSGIEGAGSSLNGRPVPIRVGISFEGRKFVRFVPVGWSYDELRHALIGQTLANGLFTEDLDDFVDGFAGGMGASVVVHWEPLTDPDEAWTLVFEGLGTAVAQLLAPNPARRGVIAGVKGTLA